MLYIHVSIHIFMHINIYSYLLNIWVVLQKLPLSKWFCMASESRLVGQTHLWTFLFPLVRVSWLRLLSISMHSKCLMFGILTSLKGVQLKGQRWCQGLGWTRISISKHWESYIILSGRAGHHTLIREVKIFSQDTLFVKHFPNWIPVAEIFLARKLQGAESLVRASLAAANSQDGKSGLEDRRAIVGCSPCQGRECPLGTWSWAAENLWSAL